jgi:hypothetical protein
MGLLEAERSEYGRLKAEKDMKVQYREQVVKNILLTLENNFEVTSEMVEKFSQLDLVVCNNLRSLDNLYDLDKKHMIHLGWVKRSIELELGVHYRIMKSLGMIEMDFEAFVRYHTGEVFMEPFSQR